MCAVSSSGLLATPSRRVTHSGAPLVHPLFSPRYYRYYWEGLESVYGRTPKLSRKGFPELNDPKDGLAVILPSGLRLFVAANDFAVVEPDIVDWADVVGQVNVDPAITYSPKVLPIGPSFGLPWSSRASLTKLVVQSGLKTSLRRIPAMIRDYLRAHDERAPLSAYAPTGSTEDRVFFLASYWREAEHANERRLRYLRAVQSRPSLKLSGGFWSEGGLPREFHDFRLDEPMGHRDYLRSTKDSVFVFNTPAVHDCLGWKLGEFLALGKAIISTPLGRTMPGDFRHGEHLHIVEDTGASILAAVQLLHEDRHYRRHLEESGRRYWDRTLRPEAVIQRMVEYGEVSR